MENLIKALMIFMRHGDVKHPTHCEHDVLFIFPNDPENFSEEEILELETLGFNYTPNEYGDVCWNSYKYGSC